jgi:hypothetical protein
MMDGTTIDGFGQDVPQFLKPEDKPFSMRDRLIKALTAQCQPESRQNWCKENCDWVIQSLLDCAFAGPVGESRLKAIDFIFAVVDCESTDYAIFRDPGQPRPPAPWTPQPPNQYCSKDSP